MDFDTASLVWRLLSGAVPSGGLVHLGDGGDMSGPAMPELPPGWEDRFSVPELVQASLEEEKEDGDSTESSVEKSGSSSTTSGSSPAGAKSTAEVAGDDAATAVAVAAAEELLKRRLRAKAGVAEANTSSNDSTPLLSQVSRQVNCSNNSTVPRVCVPEKDSISGLVSQVNKPSRVALSESERWSDIDFAKPDLQAFEESLHSGSQSSGSLNRPIPLINLTLKRDNLAAGGLRGPGGPPISAARKPLVGNVVWSDVSHLALDCRDLALWCETSTEADLAGSLARWCLRRVFRADWRRDCFLCDLPLNHSCLMCFLVLHSAPEQVSSRGFNAVVCSVMYTGCEHEHVFHQHCWNRWSVELSSCCPKCGAEGVKCVREIYNIQKRCG